MKLIVEIQEWPCYEEGGIKGTISLPGLSKGGQLTIDSVLKNTDINLRHWGDDALNIHNPIVTKYGDFDKLIHNSKIWFGCYKYRNYRREFKAR